MQIGLRWKLNGILTSSTLALTMACGGSATEAGTGANGAGANAGTGGSAGSAGAGGDGATVCARVRENYESQEATATSSEAATACATDSDCVVLSDTACGDSCTAWVVNVASRASVTAQLQAWAAANCSMCSFEIPPCVAIGISPVCVDGKCMQYHPL